MAADFVLIDTNLLVASSIREHPSHLASTSYIERLTEQRVSLFITSQICREFLVVMTRNANGAAGCSVEDSLRLLQSWRSNCLMLQDSLPVMERWLALIRDFDVKGKQIHDANIVAPMLTHGISRIGTWNVSDFERYGDIIQIEPILS